MKRIATLATVTLAALLCTACVIAPNGERVISDREALTQMSEQAIKTCGAGNVKDVTHKSFTCK